MRICPACSCTLYVCFHVRVHIRANVHVLIKDHLVDFLVKNNLKNADVTKWLDEGSPTT